MRLRQGRAGASCRHFLRLSGAAGGSGGQARTSPDMSAPFVPLPAAKLLEQPQVGLSLPSQDPPTPAPAVPLVLGGV